MSTIGEKLAQAALTIDAVKLQPDDPFTWASGFRMPIYNDNRLLLSSSEYRRLIAEGFQAMLGDDGFKPNVVAGTATAGIPHATTLADRLSKPLVYVRAKAKGHGLQNQIEGKLDAGSRVLLIEDLVSTGGSSISAVEALRSAGATVEYCYSIFSYGFSEAASKFDEVGCQLRSLLTFDVLLEVAVNTGAISPDSRNVLNEWRNAPFEWGENRGFPRVRDE